MKYIHVFFYELFDGLENEFDFRIWAGFMGENLFGVGVYDGG